MVTEYAHDGAPQQRTEDNASYEPHQQNAQPKEKSVQNLRWQRPAQGTNPLTFRSARSSYASHGHYRQLEGFRNPFWNPIWLTGPCFLMFATWYTLLAAATLVLYLVSTRNSGLTEQSYGNHYTWTYGPTAIVVVTTSLWLQVEFWCLELTPWARMRKAATPAQQGILRDYFSSWSLSAIWTAIRQGDHGVWLSTSGTILLLLTGIVSTSLINLESSPIMRSTNLTVPRTFISHAPEVTLQALTGNALIRYFGIDARNWSYPIGTSANLTIQAFLPDTTYPYNTTFQATVPGISASLDCEPIQPTNLTRRISQPWISTQAPFFSTNISIPSCTILGVTMGMGLDRNPPRINTLSTFQGWWNNYTCNDGVHNDQYPELPTSSVEAKPVVSGYDDHRLVFIASYLQWTPISGMNITRHTWVQNFTGVICKPRYDIGSYTIQMSPRDVNSKTPYRAQIQNGTPQKVEGFADIDLATLVKLDASRSLIVDSALGDEISVATSERGYLRAPDPFFTVMSRDGDLSKLSNQTDLMRRVPEAFSGIMSQAFQEYFTRPDRQQIAGTAQIYENRLQVKPLAAGFLLALLILLIGCSIALVFLAPFDCVPGNPNSIVASAKLLAANPALAHHLQAVNGLNTRQVHGTLDAMKYRTTLGPQNRDFVVAPDYSPFLPFPKRSSSIQMATSNVWWRPLNHKIWFMLMIILPPLAIIAVLEVLQHLSDRHDGIRNVSDNGSLRVMITLIPAAILSILALGFESMHVDACLTAPFNALRNGSVPLTRGLTVSLLGRTSPHVFILGLMHRLALPCITAACVMIGTFLTIVVSSLYYIQNVGISQTVTLHRVDTFSFSSHDLSSTDNLAGFTTKLLYKENLTFPRLTYGNLVFPDVNVSNATLAINGSLVTTQVPAIRPTLQCFANNASDVSYETIIRYQNGEQPVATYTTNFEIPCPGNSSVCTSSWSFSQNITDTSSNVMIGRASDVSTSGCYNEIPNTNFALQAGCPVLTFALGNTTFVSMNITTIGQLKPQLHAFMCYQYIEEVLTNISLDLPAYSIAANSPPEPIENTARNLSFSSLYYDGPVYTNSLKSLTSALGSGTIEIDPFIDALLRGKDEGNTASALFLGAEGAERLRMRAVELHGLYMANAIDSNFRIAADQFASLSSRQLGSNDDFGQNVFRGNLTQPNSQRVKQDVRTKIALQIMLGVMMLLAITIFGLTDRSLRLPMNPRSIAGTMILLAGAEMIRRQIVPVGSEWHKNEKSGSSIWDGYLFSLGWWSDDNRGKRFGIDIGRAKEDKSEKHFFKEQRVGRATKIGYHQSSKADFRRSTRERHEMNNVDTTTKSLSASTLSTLIKTPKVQIDVPSPGMRWHEVFRSSSRLSRSAAEVAAAAAATTTQQYQASFSSGYGRYRPRQDNLQQQSSDEEEVEEEDDDDYNQELESASADIGLLNSSTTTTNTMTAEEANFYVLDGASNPRYGFGGVDTAYVGHYSDIRHSS